LIKICNALVKKVVSQTEPRVAR